MRPAPSQLSRPFGRHEVDAVLGADLGDARHFGAAGLVESLGDAFEEDLEACRSSVDDHAGCRVGCFFHGCCVGKSGYAGVFATRGGRWPAPMIEGVFSSQCWC